MWSLRQLGSVLLVLGAANSLARPTNCTAQRQGKAIVFGGQHSHSSSLPAIPSSSAAAASSFTPLATTSTSVVSSEAASATSTSVETGIQNAIASTAASSAATASFATVSASAGEYTPDQYVALHTDFRKNYGAGAVTWNTTLQAFAKTAANTCVFKHTNGPYGENIAAGAGGGYTVTSGFESWANESAQYNWNSPGYSEHTGHFTQVVWKATTQIGCAMTVCADGNIFTGYGPTEYIVCEYNAPGNVIGDNNSYFIANVGTYQAS